MEYVEDLCEKTRAVVQKVRQNENRWDFFHLWVLFAARGFQFALSLSHSLSTFKCKSSKRNMWMNECRQTKDITHSISGIAKIRLQMYAAKGIFHKIQMWRRNDWVIFIWEDFLSNISAINLKHKCTKLMCVCDLNCFWIGCTMYMCIRQRVCTFFIYFEGTVSVLMLFLP